MRNGIGNNKQNNRQTRALVVHTYADNSRYFYLHDRLGSVRQVINSSGSVVKYCTLEPFGRTIESGGTFNDPFGFTGQYFDPEIGEYYLRARQYNPTLARFTARDPVFGDLRTPLTLHKYLYCGNDPANRVDPTGLWRIADAWYGGYHDTEETLAILSDATELVGKWWALGPFRAFGPLDFAYDFKGSGATFQLEKSFMKDSEFGNFVAGYSDYYNYRLFGDVGVRVVGHAYAASDYIWGESDTPWDDINSRYFISAGILRAREDRADAGYDRGGLWSFFNAKWDLLGGRIRLAEADLLSPEFDLELANFINFWNYCTK